MITTEVPRSRTRRTRSSTACDWATPSAAVGSSMITSRDAHTIARAIATLCRCPPESDATGVPQVFGSEILRSPRCCLASARMRRRARMPRPPSGPETVCSRPR